MFDIGFWELLFILIIALLVVGPERLPRLARSAGMWVGKARRFVQSVKADVDRELAVDDLRRSIEQQASTAEVEDLARELKSSTSLQDTERLLRESAEDLKRKRRGGIDDAAPDPDASRAGDSARTTGIADDTAAPEAAGGSAAPGKKKAKAKRKAKARSRKGAGDAAPAEGAQPARGRSGAEAGTGKLKPRPRDDLTESDGDTVPDKDGDPDGRG